MNYSRFYALMNKLPHCSEGTKERMVSQYTGGRTTSLREMTLQEYNALIRGLSDLVEDREAIRSARSCTLKLMTQLGVDTSDWSVVDQYCCDPRIAGTAFARISVEEHVLLQRKLRAILKKESKEGNANTLRIVYSKTSLIN